MASDKAYGKKRDARVVKNHAGADMVWIITRAQLREHGINLKKSIPYDLLVGVLYTEFKIRVPTLKDEQSFALVLETRIEQVTCASAISEVNKDLDREGIHWRFRKSWCRAEVSPAKRTFFLGTPFGLEDLVGRIQVEPPVVEWSNQYAGVQSTGRHSSVTGRWYSHAFTPQNIRPMGVRKK